jgi:GxxExxY protein
MEENEITGLLIGIFIGIHKQVGPGLLESVYEEIIAYELKKRGIPFQRQKTIGVNYEQVRLDLGFRADLIVNNKVVVEIKSIETVLPVHHKQILTYLRLTGLKVGLLVNFNVDVLRKGIHRAVNNL